VFSHPENLQKLINIQSKQNTEKARRTLEPFMRPEAGPVRVAAERAFSGAGGRMSAKHMF